MTPRPLYALRIICSQASHATIVVRRRVHLLCLPIHSGDSWGRVVPQASRGDLLGQKRCRRGLHGGRVGRCRLCSRVRRDVALVVWCAGVGALQQGQCLLVYVWLEWRCVVVCCWCVCCFGEDGIGVCCSRWKRCRHVALSRLCYYVIDDFRMGNFCSSALAGTGLMIMMMIMMMMNRQ